MRCGDPAVISSRPSPFAALASVIAAYYSVTAQYVSWVNQVPNQAFWAGGQDLIQHDPWTAPDLIALRDTHARLLQDYHCVEGSPGVIGDEAAPAPDNAAEAPPAVATLPLLPLNHLCFNAELFGKRR